MHYDQRLDTKSCLDQYQVTGAVALSLSRVRDLIIQHAPKMNDFGYVYPNNSAPLDVQPRCYTTKYVIELGDILHLNVPYNCRVDCDDIAATVFTLLGTIQKPQEVSDLIKKDCKNHGAYHDSYSPPMPIASLIATFAGHPNTLEYSYDMIRPHKLNLDYCSNAQSLKLSDWQIKITSLKIDVG